MAQLNARQQQILDFVREYHLDRSYMPSVREIQTACDISSTSVVDYNLRILEREGTVRRSPDISRGLELVGVHEAHADANVSNIEVFQIPVVGTIADGYRSEGSETITLPSELATRDPEKLFALRVKGQSMIDALITDGDLVVLTPTSQARNGEMVAAWLPLEEEATLKRFYLEGDMVRLQPENAAMDPIMVPAANVQVHGRVVGVIRRM